MDDTADTLAIYAAALGQPLLAYVLNVGSPDDLAPLLTGQRELGSAEQATVTLLQQLLASPLLIGTSEPSRGEVLKAILTQQDNNGVTFARHMHLQSGGTEVTATGADELETAIAHIAVDVFPALLLPPRTDFPSHSIGLSIEATALMFRHPQREAFEEAALNDKVLKAVFSTESEHSGHIAWVWRNTGSGGTEQLVMLPSHVLHGAWRHIGHGAPTTEVFVTESISRLGAIRRLLAGKSVPITATFAFTGVLLPEDMQRVELSKGTIEAVTPADRELAPETLKQQVSGTDTTGNHTVANYDGDVVLRLSMPLSLRTEEAPAPQTVPSWPEDMQPPESLERSVERLRLSLLLAVHRDSPPQLLPTWRYYDDPFAHGLATMWSDPRRAVGFMPTRLTEEEVASWVEWYEALSHKRIDRINVAITRILKAIAERNEPSDVLIDSVIAWENIFGTSEGEPTLRVTASLAIMLESDVVKRKALRSQLAKIYGLRSDVVHGNRSLKLNDFPLCREALDIALAAVRLLTRERTDILDLPDGAARSQHLILGG